MGNVELMHKGPESVLEYVNQNRGLLWERINDFKDDLISIEGSIIHHNGQVYRGIPQLSP